MDINEFRQKYPQYNDLGDQELADKFYNKYYSDMDRNEFMGKFLTGQKPEPKKPVSSFAMGTSGPFVRELVTNIPSSTAKAAKSMYEGIKGIPKAIGVGTPSEVRRPTVTPEEVYGGIAENIKSRYGSLENAAETLKTDPIGVLMDIGMFYGKVDPSQLAIKGVSSAGKFATKTLPKWGYKSALKMGTGKALSIPERNIRAETGLREAIMPTEAGLEKLTGKVGEIEEQIQRPITEAARAGQTISREAVAGRLAPVMERSMKQVNPLADIGDIAAVEKGFVETQPARIPIDVAQELKKGTYQQLKGKYGKAGSASIESEKALAKGLKEEVYGALESQYPELKALGEREGSLMALKDSIESAVKRIQNQEGIGLGIPSGAGAGYALGGPGGAQMGILAKALELPRVKSALSIALYKAGEVAGKVGQKIPESTKRIPSIAYGVGRYTEEDPLAKFLGMGRK